MGGGAGASHQTPRRSGGAEVSLMDRLLRRRRDTGYRQDEVETLAAEVVDHVQRAIDVLPPDRARRLQRAFDAASSAIGRVRP